MNRLCRLMNLLISISELLFLGMTPLKLLSIAEHKLVTVSLVQGIFVVFSPPFFFFLFAHLSPSVPLRQVAMFEMLLLKLFKSVCGQMDAVFWCGRFFCAA